MTMISKKSRRLAKLGTVKFHKILGKIAHNNKVENRIYNIVKVITFPHAAYQNTQIC